MGIQDSSYSHVDTMCTNEKSKKNYMCNLVHTYCNCNFMQERCFMYWPKSRYGSITPGENKLSVTFLSSVPYAEYEIRHFTVKNVSNSL